MKKTLKLHCITNSLFLILIFAHNSFCCNQFSSIKNTIQEFYKDGINNEFHLIVITPLNLRQEIPFNKIKDLLLESKNPIILNRYCENSISDIKFILLKNNEIIFKEEINASSNSILNNIKVVLKKAIYAENYYILYNHIQNNSNSNSLNISDNSSLKIIELSKNYSSDSPSPIKGIKTNHEVNQNKNNNSISPLSVNLIELQEKAAKNKAKNLSNYNEIPQSKNSKLSSNFVQISNNTEPNPGRRFLYVMIILVCCLAVFGVLIKFSLEWSESSLGELNKIEDNRRKGILEKIKSRNEKIKRIYEMNL